MIDKDDFRMLFDLAADAMFILDQDRLILELNQIAHQQLGYAKDEMLGRQIGDFVSPENTAMLNHRFAKVRNQGYLIYESAMVRNDGSVLPVEIGNRVIELDGQKAYFAVVRDITERKRLDDALRESEARFRTLTEDAPEAIVIHDLDLGRFVDATSSAERLFGCSYEEILRLGPQDLYAPDQPAGAPSFDSLRERGQRILAGEQMKFERLVRNRKGRDILCEVRLVRLPSSNRNLIRASYIDITERTKAEGALRESEQRLRTIIETDPECVLIADLNGRLLEMNAAGLAMIEADSVEEAQQRNPVEFVLPEYRQAFIDLQQRVINGESGSLEFEITGLKGTRRWVETHAAPMRGANGEIELLLGIIRDITERKQAEGRIQYLAHFDALTGLPNRAQLDDLTKYAINLAQRSHEPLALMFLDLDQFKDINDTLGHSVGDALLVALANRIRLALREEDTVSRLGGDEFIFLLHNVDANGASHVAQKLLDVIAKPYRIDAFDLNVTGSIGIALYPSDGEDMETLFRSADAAMYRAKQEGRHGFRFFTAEMQARSARHLQLVNALRQALEHNQLEVHYQPQVSMHDDRIVGAEALLRWTHPDLGSVSPTEFIPAAEDSGLILPIGEWVLKCAARQLKAWMRDGLAPMVMAVNLSAVQFRHPDLPSLVSRILDEEELPPEYLELELTEGVAMHDPQGAIAVMNNLHERGVRMSIDDFGTGYSSLSHLKKFKVYKLKIDQSFVRDISTDPEDKAIVGAIIHMAQSLGLQTIAEGVETGGQLAFLREQGCNEMQGFFYSKPLPADQFEIFARSKA